MPTFEQFFSQLVSAQNQGAVCKTVEAFGWLIFFEGIAIVLIPDTVAQLLHLPPLSIQAANYFRLGGVLVTGIGMLYIVSGRLNAMGFAFASLLDRPLVPPVMAALWAFDILPGPLALAFAVQDAGSFLWTALTWYRHGEVEASVR